MARLTAQQRKNLPSSAFAGPGRSYPVPDAQHAALAKAFASRFASPAQKDRIDAKADAKLGISDDKKKKRSPARQAVLERYTAMTKGK